MTIMKKNMVSWQNGKEVWYIRGIVILHLIFSYFFPNIEPSGPWQPLASDVSIQIHILFNDHLGLLSFDVIYNMPMSVNIWYV